jgi:hypothetical protein
MPPSRLLSLVLTLACVPSLAAQERPSPVADFSAGWAAFADESLIHHRTAAAAFRFYPTPQFSVGPELTYMIGPGTDRDLFLLGTATYEWPLLRRQGSARIVPFVTGGWGYMRHRSRFGAFIAHTSAYAGGAGLRVRLTNRVLVGSDFRFGSELQIRAAGIVTIGLGPP